MPPQISDDEASNASGDEDNLVKEEKATAILKKAITKTDIDETQESLMVESDKDEGDDDDDDEPGEDEFVVEAITSHLVDEETGEILYEVKWEGYEDESEKTWEPEANLETAPDVFKEYLDKFGGKGALLEQWAEKKGARKGKKRGRTSTASATNGKLAKRGRKTGSHPASSTLPAGAKAAEFKPPTGSWEEEVVGIDACEGSAGAVVVYLTWKGGQKSQHPLAQVYKRCPQKMLKFYESHLVFKKNDDST